MNDKTFYIMATGPSINEITDEEWTYLKDKNTIGISKFPYSSKQLKYFLSLYGEDIDAEVIPYIAELGYLDTTLLLYDPLSIKLSKLLGFNNIKRIRKGNYYFTPSRKSWFTDELEPPNSFYDTRAKNFHQPLFRYKGQTTAAINAALILGAEEIRLCGVDLNCQWSFFEISMNRWLTDSAIRFHYQNTLIPRRNRGIREKSIKDYDPNLMHTTGIPIEENKWNGRKQRGAIDLYEWIDKELRKEGMNGMYITTKNSALYGKLKYRGIIDAIN